jgi:hypothetical protein
MWDITIVPLFIGYFLKFTQQTFQLVSTALEAKEAMQSRKIAGWLGVDGYIPSSVLLCPYPSSES